MLATGRDLCHLVTWSPNGTAIFGLKACGEYQSAMLDALGLAARAARDQRPLDAAELARLQKVRLWSERLARGATLLMSVEPRRTVLLDEGGEWFDAASRAQPDC